MAKKKKKAVAKKVAKKIVKSNVAVENISTFGQGLKYPWIRGKRLWNILWVLVPIFGWLVLFGYCVNIIKAIVNGKKDGLPELKGIWDNFVLGFMMLIKLIPLIIVIILIELIPFIGWLIMLFLGVVFIPYLIINLFVKDDIVASFDVTKTWNVVMGNFKEYIIAWLKTLGYCIIYVLLSFILVGIPALVFGRMFYLAEFYSNHN